MDNFEKELIVLKEREELKQTRTWQKICIFLGIIIFLLLGFGLFSLIWGAGYSGDVVQGYKLFDFFGETYLVPTSFDEEFKFLTPRLIKAIPITDSSGILIFEAFSNDYSKHFLVATYATDRGRLLVVQVSYFKEKIITLIFIDEKLFQTGKSGYVLISVERVPPIEEFINIIRATTQKPI